MIASPTITTIAFFTDTYGNGPYYKTAPHGAFPDSNLIADANGDLLGTADAGGADNRGVVFEIQNTGTPAAPVYSASGGNLTDLRLFSALLGAGVVIQ